MLHLTRDAQNKSISALEENENDYNSGYESSSSSDTNSLTEDLDQIGRIQIPRLSSYLSKENLPSLSTLPSLPHFPTFNNLTSLPSFPNLPSANLPSFDLTEFSRYVSQYVQNATSKMSGSDSKEISPEAETRFANSVKTALATRIQMTTFLSDLKGGLSLRAAIDRLQPLTDVVHEAITLPADDESDDEIMQNDTEPVVVDEIVNREQPIMTELIVPEGEGSEGQGKLARRKRSHAHKRSFHMSKLATSRLSDGYDSSAFTGSDVDELTAEEARALTHLDSLDDFFKEDLLRKRIQRIQSLTNLSQQLKNKLVTKLMMGNYYRYINEKLWNEKGITLRKEGGLTLDDDLLAAATNDESASDMYVDKGSESDTEDTNNNNDNFDSQHEEDTYEDDFGYDYDDDDDDGDAVVLTEEDQQPSFFDESRNIMGCSHYQRNCKLECPTCQKWFTCRFCHDQQVTDHKLQRSEVKHVLCMFCNTPQFPDSSYCVNCEEELANYFCSKCVLYDNDPAKDIYHCDKCGICRLGLGLSKDYFHCDVCNICLSIDLKEHHKCVTNTTHCNCPICNEYLFTSVSKVVFMKCGHLIHQMCYDEMIKHSYKCPVCKKTVINAETQFRILDQEIRQQPLPAPYNMWRCIISCNDCKGKSNCAYHVMGLKCKYCQSYNTHQIKLIKPEEEVDEDNDDVDSKSIGEESNERITSMRLMKTNLGSNFLIEGQNDPNEPHENADREVTMTDGADDDVGNLVNFRRLTKAILGNKDVDRHSVTKMFQTFINSSIMDIAEAEVESDAKSEMEIFGGF
ncbi:CIC11C00000004757 [Sungouiella intermedia]|uniref:CIC11C00000004757 n=1 Tax=Sungouiella intermedia TaxID=45354 RepID=A0A1L0BL91_9ASCO|nr:CIC11C00000004757 [[Candida] intermedia]